MQSQNSKFKTYAERGNYSQKTLLCHSRGNRNPETYTKKWIPAYTAMTSHFATLELSLICLIFLMTGCSHNLLIQRLKDHGVTKNNTTRLRFVSSEGAFGANTKVTIEDPEVIKSVWTRINSATPTELWFASGFHGIEFYTSNMAKIPAAILMLNSSDGAHLEGDLWYHEDSEKEGYYGLWRCPGLEKLVMWHLEKQYEQQNTVP